MPNTSVRAAAEGMPNVNRRATLVCSRGAYAWKRSFTWEKP